MRKVLNEFLQGIYSNNRLLEAFNSLQGGAVPNNSSILNNNPILVFFSFVIIELIVLCFGKWLWNNVVVDLFTAVKPASNIWQILGFSILVKLITN